MKFVILNGSPKRDGLCCSVGAEIQRGAEAGGAEVTVLQMQGMEKCRVCKDGWGVCRETHRCAFGRDGFDEYQDVVRGADAFCIISPVYWSDMAEGLKSFLDKLRRCEFGQSGGLSGKPVLLVASPGGSGNGALNCLSQMDLFCRHTGAVIFDYIGVNRWNNDYKKQAAYAAAKVMAEGRKAGESF